MRLFALLIGCGFQALPNGGLDLTLTPDLAAADFAGADLSATPDLANAMVPDLATINSGPGPQGALPAGYCCNSNEECRSRFCVAASGFKYCTDSCDTDAVCNVWGAGFICNLSSGFCDASGSTCHPADQYHYGTKPLGACCAHGFATSGQECLGGLCQTTGNDANPFYCTQGCDSLTPCPGGYSCFAAFCWITQTVGDNSFLYTCQ